MVTTEKTLLGLVRMAGGLALFAAVAVVMPFDWMDAIHRWLGLGDMPRGRVVDYLARSLSAFYVFHGILLLFLSSDLRRYLPVIRLLGIVFIVFGVVMLGLDYVIGLPVYWIVGEGPVIIAVGAAITWLAFSSASSASCFGDRPGV